MQKRAWNSEAEMWAAVSEHVHRYHPTTYALSATERRYPRLVFSYYTWIRGAHNAFLDMAINHTKALQVFPKAQYGFAEGAEMEPMSFGVPWESKTTTPGYLNYSTYGPTAQGENGPMLFKPAYLPNDVMDTWNFQFDPTQPLETNVINAVQSIGQGVIGKNINMLAQPGLELLTRTDPSTGKPTQIKDMATLSDKLVSMIGTTSLLKGLGLYTPSNKGPDAANPLTDRQRQLLLTNWLGLTMKASDVNSGANISNAQSETSARYNKLVEELLKKLGNE